MSLPPPSVTNCHTFLDPLPLRAWHTFWTAPSHSGCWKHKRELSPLTCCYNNQREWWSAKVGWAQRSTDMVYKWRPWPEIHGGSHGWRPRLGLGGRFPQNLRWEGGLPIHPSTPNILRSSVVGCSRKCKQRYEKSEKHGRWLKKVIRNCVPENGNFFLKKRNSEILVCKIFSVPQTQRQVSAYGGSTVRPEILQSSQMTMTLTHPPNEWSRRCDKLD